MSIRKFQLHPGLDFEMVEFVAILVNEDNCIWLNQKLVPFVKLNPLLEVCEVRGGVREFDCQRFHYVRSLPLSRPLSTNFFNNVSVSTIF